MHTTYLLKRYICVAALTMIVLGLIGVALEYLVGISIGSASGIISAIVPAMDAGQTYARRWEKRPENGYAWRLTAAFVVLNFVVGIALLAVFLATAGDFHVFTDIAESLGPAILAAIIIGVFVIYWGASRYFFGYGAKLALREVQKANQP